MVFLWIQRETLGWFAFNTIWAEASSPYSLSVALKTIYKDSWVRPAFWSSWGLRPYYARSRADLWLPVIYFGSTFLSLLAVGKVGAAGDYFLENYAALCLCAGIAYHLLRREADFGSSVAAFIPATLAAFVVLHLHFPQEPTPYSQCEQAYEYLRASPATSVLSDNVGAVLLAGKPLLVNDPFIWNLRTAKGGWPQNDTNDVKLIRSRQVALILLGSKLDSAAEPWPNSVLSAIQENYVLTKSFNCVDARFAYRARRQS